MNNPVAGKLFQSVSVLKNRKVLFIAAAILLGLVIFLAWNRGAAKGGTNLTQDIIRGDVVNAITASGAVEAENSVPLIFKSSAVIKAIYVKEGQRVKKGDLLAEQDDTDLRAQYQQQLANLKSAEAKLALARAGNREEDIRQSEENVNIARLSYEDAKENFERYVKLFEQGAVSKVDRDKAESDYKLAEAKYLQAQAQLQAQKAGSRPEEILSAEAGVESARAQVQIARNNLESAKLFAPADGVIGVVSAVVGQRTSGAGSSSSSEDGFITLISDRLRVRAQVNEADIGRAAVGQKAYFTVNSFPGRRFTGVVESISPKAVTVSNVQLYDVIIALDQQDAPLKVGMPASVTIVVDQKEGVLLLPKTAVSYAVQEAQKAAVQSDGAGTQRQSGAGGQSGMRRQSSGSDGAAGGSAQGRGGSAQAGGGAQGNGARRVP
ncbi:MAG: HlyD family efflux transporter periplasmic adaptor subunit, partial [Peptococcaceae bacterium]|nr:HlyD family efflux transporter periplasmic adaptor subunit [Peptococcaceae bacterium]